jgi:hypothetical protein
MKMKSTRNKELSHINNLEDLHKEILRVKADLKIQEQGLHERAKRLPAEALKAGAGAALPAVVKNVVATRSFGVVKTVAGLFFGRSKSTATTGQQIVGAAKRLGMITVVKTALRLFKRRRSKKQDHKKEAKK